MGHFSSTQRIPVNYSNATWLDEEYKNSSSQVRLYKHTKKTLIAFLCKSNRSLNLSLLD